jgi:endoglucanase
MKSDLDFLRVRGSEIVNGNGEVVRLRGFCLGGWMNMENFIIGYPGHESGMRAAVASVLGEAKAQFFFERFLHHFFTEDDVRFLRSLGCNVIRVALNYRHFESDERPFEYKPEGFALLDKVIGWARAHQMYVILDLHAVQGWQNAGWHCDNASGKAHLWGQKVFEDRAVALWEEFARRYRDEPWVAGYNVANEPDTNEIRWLNHYYRRVTDAILAIAPDHILFLEGNRTSQQFDQLDPPFDDHTIYSSHYYFVPSIDDGEYPGTFHGEFYDRDRLKEQYQERTAWIREHGVPHWFGEFGCIYSDATPEPSRLRIMADMLDIAEEYGDHWTIWTYKDIGKMGLVYANPESEWMRRTKPVREIKTALRCDSWIERHEAPIAALIQQIAEHASTVVADQPGSWSGLDEALRFAICDGLLSGMLLPAFAEQFRGMSEDEIDQMMQSFAFRNCVQREGLVQLIREVVGRTEEELAND